MPLLLPPADFTVASRRSLSPDIGVAGEAPRIFSASSTPPRVRNGETTLLFKQRKRVLDRLLFFRRLINEVDGASTRSLAINLPVESTRPHNYVSIISPTQPVPSKAGKGNDLSGSRPQKAQMRYRSARPTPDQSPRRTALAISRSASRRLIVSRRSYWRLPRPNAISIFAR